MELVGSPTNKPCFVVLFKFQILICFFYTTIILRVLIGIGLSIKDNYIKTSKRNKQCFVGGGGPGVRWCNFGNTKINR